ADCRGGGRRSRPPLAVDAAAGPGLSAAAAAGPPRLVPFGGRLVVLVLLQLDLPLLLLLAAALDAAVDVLVAVFQHRPGDHGVLVVAVLVVALDVDVEVLAHLRDAVRVVELPPHEALADLVLGTLQGRPGAGGHDAPPAPPPEAERSTTPLPLPEASGRPARPLREPDGDRSSPRSEPWYGSDLSAAMFRRMSSASSSMPSWKDTRLLRLPSSPSPSSDELDPYPLLRSDRSIPPVDAACPPLDDDDAALHTLDPPETLLPPPRPSMAQRGHDSRSSFHCPVRVDLRRIWTKGWTEHRPRASHWTVVAGDIVMAASGCGDGPGCDRLAPPPLMLEAALLRKTGEAAPSGYLSWSWVHAVGTARNSAKPVLPYPALLPLVNRAPARIQCQSASSAPRTRSFVVRLPPISDADARELAGVNCDGVRFTASVRLRIVGLELEFDGRIIAYPSIGGGSAGKAAAVCFENRKASRIRETRRLGSRKGSQATNKNDREERLPRNIGPLGRKRVQESLENRGQKSGREQPRLLLHELERGHVCVDGGS
ncbi:hypothetical protein THAOC_11816, partial [Thalassiosira oceanica]